MSFVGSIAAGSTGAPTRWSGSTKGRIQGSPANGVNYPSPFFDVAHTYLPATVKQLFHWCRYYFLTNPLINATVTKLSEYPVTDIIIEHADAKVRQRWEEYYHDHLNFRAFQIECGLDHHAYGNSIVSLGYPFKKHLVCVSCKFTERAEKIRQHWTFTNNGFRLTCPNCGSTNEAEAFDQYYRNASGINLIRWNCENVQITHNDTTGDSTYFYSIPAQLRNDIVIGKKDVVETVPQIFIQAVRQQKGIVFSRDNLFHMKRATLAHQDRGWGIPLILPVLKDVFYLQLMKKAQEAILLEHVVPLRVLFPQAGSAASDPYLSINLMEWKEQVAGEIARWRWDCISPETLVETQRGLRRADEIVAGDRLKNHLGDYSSVEKAWRRPLRDNEAAYRFSVRGLRAVKTVFSEGHPLLAAKKINNGNGHKLGEPSFIRVKDLHPGDYVAYPVVRSIEKRLQLDLAEFVQSRAYTEKWLYVDHTSSEVPEAFEWLEANGHPPDRKLLLEEKGWSVNQYKTAQMAIRDGRTLRRVPRFIPFDEQLAWVVGLYLAEGNTSPKQVLFAGHSKEKEILHHLQCFFTERFGANGFTAVRSEYGVQHYFSSIVAAEFFGNLCPGISITKEIPDVYRKADNHIVISLLKGLIDGDGCWHRDGYSRKISYTSGSVQLAEGVRSLLLSLGVPVSITYRPGEQCVIAGRKATSHGDYRVISHGDSRNYLIRLFSGGEVNYDTGARIGLFKDGYFWHRIDSKTEVVCPEVIAFQMSADSPQVRLQDDTETHGTFCTWAMAGVNCNYIPILPLPIGNQTIGGDGRALLMSQEIQIWSEQIMVGMGVPKEFLLGGMCLDFNELAITGSGLKTLGELVPSEKGSQTIEQTVVNHTGRVKAIQGHNVGEKQPWCLRTRSGHTLRGAGTHPILTFKDDLSLDFKNMEDLAPGDFVVRKVGADLWSKSNARLPILEKVADGKGRPPRRSDLTLPAHMTEDLATVLGYLVSEGSGDKERVAFGNTDPEVMSHYVDCFTRVFSAPLSMELRKSSAKDFEKHSYAAGELKDCAIAISWSRDLADFLVLIGMRWGSENKVIPWSVLQSTKACVSAFLRAYYEGDGTVSVKDSELGHGYARATSVSEKLVKQLQVVLGNAGIESSIYLPTSVSPIYKIDVRTQLFAFQEFAGFTSSTKQQTLASIVRETDEDIHIPYAQERIAELRKAHPQPSWVREKITPVLTEPTYDVKSAARALGLEDATGLYSSVSKGELKAKKRSKCWVIKSDDLKSYCLEYGLPRRNNKAWPRIYKGATLASLRSSDLSLVETYSPGLRSRLARVLEGDLRFDEVVSIEPEECLIPMADLSVPGSESYVASGIICHNSYAGTNVSMRMLENAFLSYIGRQKQMANWIMRQVAAFMGWPRAKVNFKPFKMADDLQRKAYLFQLNSANKISDTTLLAESDIDQDAENEIMVNETADRLHAMKLQQLAMAQVQGEASVIMAKYQAKAQQVTQEVMMSGAAPGEPGAPDGISAPGIPVGQPGTDGSSGIPSAYQSSLNSSQSMSVQPVPGSVAQGDPSQGESMNVDIQQYATMLAQQYIQLSADEQQMALQNLEAQSPELAQLVIQEVHRMQAEGGSSGMGGALGESVSQVNTQPLPEQRAPRRMAALV